MALTDYTPIGAYKLALGKPKVHLLKKLSRKQLRKVWYAKHPVGFASMSARGRIDTALGKLTKREIAELIAYT